MKEGLQLIGDFLVDQLIKTIDKQGSRATGQLQDTMRSVVTSTGTGFTISIYAQNYADSVEKGVPAGVKVSPYALAKWVEVKGIATGEKEIKSLAFAIRQKIFNEGSVQFREKKKGFIEVSLDSSAKAIFKMLLNLFTKEVSTTLSNTVRNQQKNFSL